MTDKTIQQQLEEHYDNKRRELNKVIVDSYYEVRNFIDSTGIELDRLQEEELERLLFKFGNARRLEGQHETNYSIGFYVEMAMQWLLKYGNIQLCVQYLLNLRYYGYKLDDDKDYRKQYVYQEAMTASNKNLKEKMKAGRQ